MPQQESAPPTDAAAATLTPASLIADGRYTRATCGMDRELLAMLRAAVKEDPAALRRLCTNHKTFQQRRGETGRRDGTGVHHRGAAPGSANVCVLNT